MARRGPKEIGDIDESKLEDMTPEEALEKVQKIREGSRKGARKTQEMVAFAKKHGFMGGAGKGEGEGTGTGGSNTR